MDRGLLEDFGQRVDLTRRIREVLVNYPEGTTVLKELIQNADDAGATTVRFCLDRRSHRAESLLSEKLSQWQGPALLAYNDAVFTESDFSSICRIGDSKKQDQTWKTGRFGVGFNSVYHLTDLPSFVSDKYVVLFDPQGEYLPNVSSTSPGKRLDYVSSSAFSFYEDQFSPYMAFGCDMKRRFPGTLFRFPLRNPSQATVSKLSKQSYVEEDIISIFSQLYDEVILSMLFLKNVNSIEMYVWNDAADEPQKVYSCCITPVNESIIRHRQKVHEIAETVEIGKRDINSFFLNFLCESFVGAHAGQKSVTYFIVQAIESSFSRLGTFCSNAARKYDLRLLPWASVAARISEVSCEDSIKEGQAFCFLPLPIKTGLNVHVNGYFEVSSNRRTIWYGDDMDRGGKLRSEWNKLLLEDAVSEVFCELLALLSKQLGPSELYYSLWPSGLFEEPWKFLVNKIYEKMASIPLIYSDIGEGRWVSPVEAFFTDVESSNNNFLKGALLSIRIPVVSLPRSLVEMFIRHIPSLESRILCPKIVRDVLKSSTLISAVSRHHRLAFLEYCLNDLADVDVGKNMVGLPLIPLADSGFASFSSSEASPVFVCEEMEYQLLEGVLNQVLDRTIDSELYDRLSRVARASATNVQIFKPLHIVKLLPRIFPAEWKSKDGVSWNAHSSKRHPTSSWLRLFWQYLNLNCDDLLIFDDWPILPSTSGMLYRLSRFSKLLNSKSLSTSLKNILLQLGCKILSEDHGIEHKQLSKYVQEANGGGVLSAISDILPPDYSMIETSFQLLSVDDKNELRHFLLDPKWYHNGRMEESHISYCKKLPIFRVYGGVSKVFLFSDLEIPEKYLPPENVPEDILGQNFLFCTSDEKVTITKYFGIRHMEMTLFYKTNVFSRITELPSEFCDQIMINVLHDLPQLCSRDSSFKEIMSNLAFVPTTLGTRKSAQSLYDPRIEELHDLLEDYDSFPHSSFQEPGILNMLQYLGLRTSVSAETVIQCARNVEFLMHNDQMKGYYQGKALLSYLELNCSKWVSKTDFDSLRKLNRLPLRGSSKLRLPASQESDLEKFWNDLKLISWCPVLVSAPFSALPWPSVSSILAPPRLVRPKADLWLVSSSMRILDGECCSSTLASALGWSSPPSGSVLTAQLLEMGKNNKVVLDHGLRQELTVVMPKIYSLLMGLIGSEEMDIIKVVLEGCRWIWVGDGFATAEEVVLSGHLHFTPFIRIIPVDLASFKELFLELGVQESLKPIDYANILSRMSSKNGDNPLDRKELNMSILIAQHLADVCHQGMTLQIYLPDTFSRLFPATDLLYNDAPWLTSPGNELSARNISEKDIYKFVHGSISSDVAEKLGVRSFRSILLAESSDAMNFGLHGVAEAFGQHEDLTTRLKHIIEMYADGPGILFELVQNAEDAGATEVGFLLDRTKYGTSSILSPEMADWQGPALYCFNNSVFSPQDLYAISRIGQDRKLDKPLSIGRFGLGFNSVYHFTDIPGFVSGENIVIFDPHACHLPGISPTHPGLRIKYVGKSILEQFPDQFAPFLHFGCDLSSAFPGTIFRFPLRNEKTASRSQIKKQMYSPEDVSSLLISFSDIVSETLPFLRNVKVISIFQKEGLDHEMQLSYRVSRFSINETAEKLHPHNNLLEFVHDNTSHGLTEDKFLEKLNKTSNCDLPWNCEKIAIAEKHKSGENLRIWLVSECIGGSDAVGKHILSTRPHTFIPWGCVAAPLYSYHDKQFMKILDSVGQIDPNIFTQYEPAKILIQDGMDLTGRAFCFLPLPITTGLPVHMNAYFELSSNRRDLWLGEDMAGGGKMRSDWNTFLLLSVIAPSYARFLSAISSEIGPNDLFFSFWPTVIGVEPWASLVTAVYRSISDLGLCVLYTEARGGQWISTRQAIFPDFSFPKADILVRALCQSGLPLITFNKSIAERFIYSCPSLHVLNPPLLRRLLVRRQRKISDKNAMLVVLEYCLSDEDGSLFYNDLYGLPFILLADGSVTTFEKYGKGERVIVSSEQEYNLLLDFLPHFLLDCEIPDVIFDKLRRIAKSKQFNLSLLTCQSLMELLTGILPPDWLHAKKVIWNPGCEGHPTREWIQLLWNYLKLHCDDLMVFSKWPILPIGDSELFQLVPNSNVIKNEGWTENLVSLLGKIGCFFLSSNVEIQHPQLKNFVQHPTAPGILNALQAVAQSPQDIVNCFADALEGEIHELRSFMLQSKWFSGDLMSTQHIHIIKLLPLFETFKSRKFVPLTDPEKYLKPEGIDEFLLDDSFIRIESEREKNILRCHMDIREPSKAEFYSHHVLNHMSDLASNPSIISSIFNDLRSLINADNALKAFVSNYPFVQSANGCWQSPNRLYDPRNLLLKKLLSSQYFPSDQFSTPEILDILAHMGLRFSLDFTGLLDCARSVSMLYESGDVDAPVWGKRFFSCLCYVSAKLASRKEEVLDSSNNGFFDSKNDSTNSEKLLVDTSNDMMCLDSNIHECLGDLDRESEDEFWLELKNISWCPISVVPPMKGIPWSISKSLVACPVITRPKSQMWIVSSRMRILDSEFSSAYIEQRLGWQEQPDIRVLCAQLMEISQLFLNLDLDSEERAFLVSQLQKEIPVLYSKLQSEIDSEDFRVAKSCLGDSPCVWTGDSFVSSAALAFDSPINYPPYLYTLPSELGEFRALLMEMGVGLTFTISGYLRALQSFQCDLNGQSLSTEQLHFVLCVLEAIVDCSTQESLNSNLLDSLLIPDSSGKLSYAADVVYNDAPWMEKSFLDKLFVHPVIPEDISKRLGLQSLRSLSFFDDEMVKNVPCMEYSKLSKLLDVYGGHQFLLFDILELADCCDAKKVHFIYDKRVHPRQSLLQQNLAEFQGPALLAIIEGATLTPEEMYSLQLYPPWKLRGVAIRYGLALLSCHSVTDILSIISGGYLYMFDPLGLAFTPNSSATSSAKMFSLSGTDLTEKFHDQFYPMMINEDQMFSKKNSIIIRMPLSPRIKEPGISARIQGIFEEFIDQAPATILSLKSVEKVCLSTWETGGLEPSLDLSVSVDPECAKMRNPFPEKKWKKFQLSRLFSSSNAGTKSRIVDLHVTKQGDVTIEKWLVVLSMGSGQTRNMALDRRYISFDLTPVGGIAAHIAQNGQPIIRRPSSSILAPLSLSHKIDLPVAVIGSFLVFHNGGRYLFDNCGINLTDSTKQLMEAWNKELMLCVRDSYIDLVQELHKHQAMSQNASSGVNNNIYSLNSILKLYNDSLYSLWPRTQLNSPSVPTTSSMNTMRANEEELKCLVQYVVKPFYKRVTDLPVWRLYRGDLVKASEGMFLSQSAGGGLPPENVCSFIKEHYPVFSVPSDLASEVLAVGFDIREIKPHMVRSLLKASRSLFIHSTDVYFDVLEYCVSDIELLLSSSEKEGETSGNSEFFSNLQSTDVDKARHLITQGRSGTDALEIVSSFGRALYDFGCGVVEDISKTGNISLDGRINPGRTFRSIGVELKGLPIPTAGRTLSSLGHIELWIGTREQQSLMHPLLISFIDSRCLERPALSCCLERKELHGILKLEPFSPLLLSKNLKSILSKNWVNHVLESSATPWISWDKKSKNFEGPSEEWIKLFWQSFNSQNGDLSLVSEWPFIPAFLNRPILCRIRVQNLVFIPPLIEAESTSLDRMRLYISSFEMIKSRYPWLFRLLNQCNIPVYDMEFSDLGGPGSFFPPHMQPIGKTIASKILASRQAGYFSEPEPFHTEDRDRLFHIFSSDFKSSAGTSYNVEEISALRALPIFRTAAGSYTSLSGNEQYLIPPDAFYHPRSAHCLSFEADEAPFYQSLGVSEINNHEILLLFALPGFEEKPLEDQENILKYIYVNWHEIQSDHRAIEILKGTQFVRNANEHCLQLFKPKDLLDPYDPLLMSVFLKEKDRFPGERFSSDRWLRILNKIGLRTSLEADMLLECARKVELLGKQVMEDSKNNVDAEMDSDPELYSSKGIPSELWLLAESVVEKIFSNLTLLYNSSFCGVLSTIAFVPAEEGISTGKKGGKKVLCAFNEAVLLEDWSLAWSCSPILVKANVVPPQFSRGALRFKSPPPFPTVLKHLQTAGRNGGEDTLAHWSESLIMETVEESCGKVLKYLDRVWGSLSNAEIQELQNVPFIPVANGTRFVLVSSLFVRLAINLAPFAFQLPSRYLPFAKILNELGLRDLLSHEYAVGLLLNIQKSRGYQRLNPNELRAVMEILHFICDDESTSSKQFMGSVVPDEGSRLVTAKSCVYVDSYGSKLLNCIDTSTLRFVHPQVSERMCISLGINRLSDVIIEELQDQEQLILQNEIQQVPLQGMREKLLLKSFCEALWSIMPSQESLTLEQLQPSLNSISEKLQFVKYIHTRFILQPKGKNITKKGTMIDIPEWEDEEQAATCHRTTHFVDKSKTIILVAELPSYISAYDVIAAAICRALGLATALPIGPLLSSPPGSEKAVASTLRWASPGKEATSTWENYGDGSCLGKELLPQDALQVQLRPLRPFYTGEIIAWRLSKGEKLKYGRVVNDVRPSSGQALYRFAVETTTGKTQSLLSSQVLSFKSLPMSADTSSSSQGPENPTAITSSSKQSSPAAEEKHQQEGVTAEEVIQAVNEMLTASGINMDAEKQSLMQTNLTLQEQLRESQVAILIEQERAESAAKEADAVKSAWACRICLGAEVEVLILPCGHVLCKRCSSAVSRCPFCRVQVSKTVKIYRP